MARQTKQRSKRRATGKATSKPVAPSANLNDLRQRANQGDPAAQAKLCRALDANPPFGDGLATWPLTPNLSLCA